MSPTWTSEPPPQVAIAPGGWALACLRGAVLGTVLGLGLSTLLALRLVERPLYGAGRPWTPWITRGVCRAALRIIGIGYHVEGYRMRGAGAMVANHASWLDILVLNARERVYFVSKDEVAGWPVIGWAARATGTVFIRRRARDAGAQKALFERRLGVGHKLLFFPEGTSTDGRRVLPFKSTLFAAFFTDHLKDTLEVQPVTVVYTAPDGQDARFYGWWGDMEFGAHFLQVLAQTRQGRVSVTYHDPVAVADFPSRKALSAHLEAEVRRAFPAQAGEEPSGIGPRATAQE